MKALFLNPRLAVFFALMVCSLPVLLRLDYVTHLAILICIAATLALSLNVTMRMGQLSLAQGAFMGVGAYGSALLNMKLGLSIPLSFLGGALASFVLALALGPIFLRIKGVYFVLITFCFGQIVDLVLQDWTSLTGGNNGLTGIPSLIDMHFGKAQPLIVYGLGLLMTGVAYFLVQRTYKSRIGTVLDAIEDKEALTLSFGLSVIRHRVAAFAFSAFLAGAAGAFFAHYIGFLNPSTFALSLTIQALMINVIGGSRWPAGVLVGALIVVPLPELLRDAKDYQYILFGAIVIVMLLFANQGIVGLLKGQRR